jgi:hypothetical protein
MEPMRSVNLTRIHHGSRFNHGRPHIVLGRRCRRHCIPRRRRAPSATVFRMVTSSGVLPF